LARSAFRLGELAAEFGCELVGDPQVKVSCVATLTSAKSGDLSFFANKAYRDQLRSTTAGAVLLRATDAEDCPVNALLADDPYLIFARIADLLYPQPDIVAGKHASAVISASAKIAENVQISAHTVIEDEAIIEADVFLGPGVFVGPRCRIGRSSRLLANVTIVQDVELGQRCIIHPGAVIGSDGFGNARGDQGWVKVPQVGRALIGNDVEIGANTTIDRGALDDTVIEDGVRLDNLVHVAHNVRIGQHSALAAQNGIAGSTTIGKRCMFGGQVGIDGHLNICDDVIVGGKSVLTKDITDAGFYAGTFAAEKDKDWKRKVARFRRLENLVSRVRNLEKTADGDRDD
jgi:UDP-3-O-[3-hydroxymyristoyl] glucosamine N-acyltransferase